MAIYMWIEYTPIAIAGIYQDETNGLISLSSDGSTWITMTDKNLGATTVYNDGDTLSNANCGNYYQRGNNYGFAGPDGPSPTTSSSQVNASTYGPGNYYSSSTFITRSSSPYNRATTQVDDLWGGVTGTNIAMQGPCSTGYHVPSSNERGEVLSIMSALGINTSVGSNMKTYFKMPRAGKRDSSNGSVSTIGEGYYRSCSPRSNNASINFYTWSSNNVVSTGKISDGYQIRPFANTPIQPDSSRTVLYQ